MRTSFWRFSQFDFLDKKMCPVQNAAAAVLPARAQNNASTYRPESHSGPGVLTHSLGSAGMLWDSSHAYAIRRWERGDAKPEWMDSISWGRRSGKYAYPGPRLRDLRNRMRGQTTRMVRWRFDERDYCRSGTHHCSKQTASAGLRVSERYRLLNQTTLLPEICASYRDAPQSDPNRFLRHHREKECTPRLPHSGPHFALNIVRRDPGRSAVVASL